MNKSGFTVALAALVVVLCAAGASATLYDEERLQWHCGVAEGEARIRTDAPLVWTNNNDKICAKACKTEREGFFPVYKKGNYALFTDGLFCCCSVRRLFTANKHPYGETRPHISHLMADKLGINRKPPTD